MKKKIIWAASIIFVIALTQVLLVKLVYAHKLSDKFSHIVSIIYNLPAGEIQNEDGGFKVYLKDYFEHKFFVEKFIDKQLNDSSLSQASLINKEPSPTELAELIWRKIVKDAWLEKNAKVHDLSFSEDDVLQYLAALDGEEALKKDVAKYDLSYEQYQDLVIKYYILEAKVDQYFLSSYADKISAQKAQEAYALLEAENGDNFEEVAKDYSDDTRYSGNSIFLMESELVGYYQPIKELAVGDFSKIVQVPGGYAIWKLNSILEGDGERVWEIKGINISAKTVDEFLDEYLDSSQVEKLY